MARYVVLIRFTEQGARNIKNSPARARDFRQAAEKAGVKVEAQLWTAGSWDGILILSGANDQELLGTISRLAAQGNVRTETLRAFDEAEFAAIVGG
jgi:uncharacterized protein with GYD domain